MPPTRSSRDWWIQAAAGAPASYTGREAQLEDLELLEEVPSIVSSWAVSHAD